MPQTRVPARRALAAAAVLLALFAFAGTRSLHAGRVAAAEIGRAHV